MSDRPAAAAAVRWDALAIHPDDDVAVVLHDVQAGEMVAVRQAGSIVRAKVNENIPLGHKVALRALGKGAPVRKYGECIGVATADIAAGSHVHVHNMVSRRARKTT
jgi:hypothetical protein